jgi:hypothetical protein
MTHSSPTDSRFPARRWLAAAGCLAVVLMAGCSGGGQNSSSTSGVDAAGGVAVPAAAPDNSAKGSTAQGSVAVVDRALIRTADLTVRVDESHLDSVTAKAERIASDAGGTVDSEQRDSAVDHPSAQLVLRVPPDDLTKVLNSLADLGKSIRRSTSTQDVTQTVVDVNSRITTMQASIARLRALLDRAGTIADLTALESQLTQREADLESLQQRQLALAAQTSMATITLQLITTEADSDINSPLDGLIAGLKAIGTFIIATVTVLAVLLPFLILAALAWIFGRRLYRRRPDWLHTVRADDRGSQSAREPDYPTYPATPAPVPAAPEDPA